ncbi:MAG: glycosyltransferase family 39 protein [Candidatus Blackburnbacteria bacterium]|nr:glycosyltransferase family 39 protein [Candidatus Blackburnbacteria bacterium]
MSILKVRKRAMLLMQKKFNPLYLLLVFVVFLRVPSLFEPYWYGDEAIYLTLGEAVGQGLVLYRDIFDHKPPAIYLLASLAGSVFWFRLILLLWHLATIVIFWDLAKKLFDKKNNLVVLATSIFAFLTAIPLFEGNIANSEIFMIGPTIAAFLIAFSVKKPTTLKLFSAGLLFSLSILFKVPAIFDFFALVAFWLLNTRLNAKDIFKATKNILVVGGGVLAPILASMLYFFTQGALPQYLNTVWSQNFFYISLWSAPSLPLGDTIAQAGLSVRAAIFILILGLLFLFKRRFDGATLFAVLWFTFALFASLLSGRPYSHYIIQVLPPLALLLSILVFGREKYRFLPVSFLFFFVFSLVFYKFYYYPVFAYYGNFLAFVGGQKTKMEYFDYFDKRMPMIYQLAQALSSRTTKNDRIFIWGTAPEVYALSRRLPAARYITSFHIKDFNGEQETADSLLEKKPKYIIVFKNETARFPQLASLLQKNYIYLETIGMAEIWKRFDLRLMNRTKI